MNEVRDGKAEIRGEDAHHLTRVLRVEPGQRYEISDNGHAYLAEIEAARKDLVTFTVLDRLPPQASVAGVTLLASLVRFERFEDLLEKATELGVERIIPVRAERSEKGLEAAALKRMTRWRRIVREASEQSRRTWLPVLEEPIALADVDPGTARPILLDEDPAAPPLLRALHDAPQEAAILVGPEGGWTDRERAFLRASKWEAVSLGPLILKAETAAIAALAILQAAWQAEA